MNKRFALIGAAGYIAPKHMRAIKGTDNELVAAFDPYDGVGIMDSYFPDADFFTEFERFDRHIEKLRRGGNPIDYLSICSPNYLHDAHIRFGLRNGCNVICEKPIVLNPWNIDAIEEIESESDKKVFTILQLRLHKSIKALKEKVDKSPKDKVFKIDLKYITSRGKWYQYSWKGNSEKSGGIATNIGVHFFDMLGWIFGDLKENVVDTHTSNSAKGKLIFDRAKVNWHLSIDYNLIPDHIKEEGKRTYRTIIIDKEELEFSDGFSDLHLDSYKEILDGRGFTISESRKAIDIVSTIRRFQTN